jgi:hypothetical protein
VKQQSALALVALAVGCAETGQDRLEVPLYVAGADVSQPLVAAGNVPVMLDRADLAFGPLYLCAGNTAGDACDTALLEWLDTIVVDTTSPEPARAGALSGVSGSVRSWMYDLGISSQLTRAEPFVLEAATQLGGASFVVDGRADAGGVDLPFSASISVQRNGNLAPGIPVVQKRATDRFFRVVGANETGLVVRFDPTAWISGIDFRPFLKDERCSPGGPLLVCLGSVETTCSGDGTEMSSRDCSDLGQRCISGRGCAEALTLAPDTEAFRALQNALVNEPPAFEWDFVP